MYCSGTVTTDAVPQDSYVISGEQSVDKVAFVVSAAGLYQSRLRAGREGRR